MSLKWRSERKNQAKKLLFRSCKKKCEEKTPTPTLLRFNEISDLFRKVMINAFPAILMTVREPKHFFFVWMKINEDEDQGFMDIFFKNQKELSFLLEFFEELRSS